MNTIVSYMPQSNAPLDHSSTTNFRAEYTLFDLELGGLAVVKVRVYSDRISVSSFVWISSQYGQFNNNGTGSGTASTREEAADIALRAAGIEFDDNGIQSVNSRLNAFARFIGLTKYFIYH